MATQVKKNIRDFTPYMQVREFHTVFGHPIKEMIQLDIFDTNKKLVDFRISLIDEEIKEFLIDGLNKKNLVESIDALADILYVVFGACLVFGINYDDMFSETLDEISDVDEFVDSESKQFNLVCNAGKFDYSVYKASECKNNLDKYKNIKNIDELRNVSFEEICDRGTTDERVQALLDSQTLLKEYCDDKNMNKVACALDLIVRSVYKISNELSVNMYKIFCEVHRSNMTKVCNNEEDAQKTVEDYKKNDDRYDSPSYKLSPDGKYWVVFNKSTSKILKSIKFELPQLKQFINFC